MLLAQGKSSIHCDKNITNHTKSCFYIFKEFCPEFKYELVEEKDNDLAIIQIEGLGVSRNDSQVKELKDESKV